MILNVLTFSVQPVITFACSVTVSMTPFSRNIIDHREGLIEISCCSQKIRIRTENENYSCGGNIAAVFLPNERYELFMPAVQADTQNRPSFLGIAVKIPDISVERLDTETLGCGGIRALLADETRFLTMPAVDFSDDEILIFTSEIRAAINHYAKQTAAGTAECLSVWYRLLGMIDTQTRAYLRLLLPDGENEMKTAVLYERKAKSYIAEHFREPIRVSDIAASMNITPNYLTTVFRRNTGKTVIEYLNYYRVQRIRYRIVTEPEADTERICLEEGFRSYRQAQRVFVKYCGVGMSRCRQLDSGITLFHENPWEHEGLDHDIFIDPADSTESS